jgi:hypothetical protein
MTSERAFPTAPWAAATVDRAERDFFAWALLAGLLLLAALAWPFFAGRAYLGGELGDFHLPARAFYAQQLARGEPFDWMPGIFAGFYLTGEGQAGTYHPLHWLLYRFLPLRTALGWEYLSSYPVMAAGLWVLLRRRLRLLLLRRGLLRRRGLRLLRAGRRYQAAQTERRHCQAPAHEALHAHIPFRCALPQRICMGNDVTRVQPAVLLISTHSSGSRTLETTRRQRPQV